MYSCIHMYSYILKLMHTYTHAYTCLYIFILVGKESDVDYNFVVDPLQEPKPHPDTVKHEKMELIIEACDKLMKVDCKGFNEIYLWIDYGCLNQDDDDDNNER